MPELHVAPAPYKKVKVHLSLSKSRYVGHMHVYPPKTRVSDVLNEADRFMTLSEVEAVESIAKDATLVMNKVLIAYVHVLEEFKRVYLKVHTGDFVQAKIRMVDHQIEGEVFIPTHMKNMERDAILNRASHFLNVRNGVVMGTRERYNYLAVSTHQIRSLEFAG
jgi:hypothetical protein